MARDDEPHSGADEPHSGAHHHHHHHHHCKLDKAPLTGAQRRRTDIK